jgi:hypothetical protein
VLLFNTNRDEIAVEFISITGQEVDAVADLMAVKNR